MDFDYLNEIVDLSEFKNSTVLITGASGLIGSELVRCFSLINRRYGYNISLILIARNVDKLFEICNSYGKDVEIKIITGDIIEFKSTDFSVDFIIHCASTTESRLMVSNPVEVIRTNIYGTDNILCFAASKKVKSVIYLSSMEVYGFSKDENLLNEEEMQYLSPLQVRSCYPESKRMAENLCVSYFAEHKVPVKIIRLAQTFGHGVKPDDRRVFAEFARCVKNNKNIILKTDGSSKRMYLDTEDAVGAILTVLLKGQNGEAYNAANKSTYCSIMEMAEAVVKFFGDGNIAIKLDIGDNDCFPPAHKFNLDTTKIENLGWHPQTDLIGMYKKLIASWKNI